MSEVMKPKVEAAVAICVAGLDIPKDSSILGAEIRKIGRSHGIKSHVGLTKFVSSVKYYLKKKKKTEEEFEKVANKWFKWSLYITIIIAVLFALLFKTTLSSERMVTTEPYFRVCLTIYKNEYLDVYSVKEFTDD